MAHAPRAGSRTEIDAHRPSEPPSVKRIMVAMSFQGESRRPQLQDFRSDNIAGTSPEIMDAVAAVGAGVAVPYGDDEASARMRATLSEVFEREVDVFPVSTGTAANAISLAALTPPWGSILGHADSHITNDEAGAPEFYTGGAKIVHVTGENSKIDVDALRKAGTKGAGDVHSVQPSVLSLTQATETGSVYDVAEVETLSGIAREAGLRVHMDGARFANALAALDASPADLTWRAGVDVLSFGATKNGAMTADAVVSFDPSLRAELGFRHKRAGQLTSKMRFHSAQLEAYLADDLWLRNARHANAMAARLRDGLAQVPGVKILGQPRANIVFAFIPDEVRAGLKTAGFEFHDDRWERGVTRFVTSFAHTKNDVDALCEQAGAR